MRKMIQQPNANKPMILELWACQHWPVKGLECCKIPTLDLPLLDVIADFFRRSSIDLTSHTESCPQNLFHRSAELLRQRLKPHGSGNLDDFFEGDWLGVLDIFLLLPISRRLFESLDYKGGRRRDDRDCSLPILNSKLDSHTKAFLLNSVLESVLP